MNTKKLTLLLTFTCLFLFAVISRIFFNDFQEGWEAYVKKDYKTAHELWLPLAEQGDSKAQFFLGFMHDFGFGLPENDQEAVKWYRLAAEQGDSRAQLFTGLMYANGQGVPQNDQEAIKWYRLAAEQGYEEAKVNILKLERNDAPQTLQALISDAENGIVKAQYNLGMMYANGQGVRENHQEAIKWYRLAVGQGYERAKSIVYDLAKKNVPQALKVLKEDAEKGVAKAQYNLGMMYANGWGVPQNDQEAIKWYLLAAEQMYAGAKVNIYTMARKNVPQALKFLTKDAENGVAEAQISLGTMYANGWGVPQNDREAIRWYLLAAEQMYAGAKINIYAMAIRNVSEALKILIDDAKNSDVEAQYSLGMMYANGQGVPQDDREAIKWYRLAAEQEFDHEKATVSKLMKKNVLQILKLLTYDAENGIAEAQIRLGMMYQMGAVVPQSDQEAIKWYRLAAGQGNSKAQFIMGLMYANGWGVPQEDQEALKWYRHATEQRVASKKIKIYNLAQKNVPEALEILTRDAENGVAEAQFFMGLVYARGSEVPVDHVLAHMWYNLSGLQGHKDATSKISLLEKNMSPQQIEQAQEMVRDWKPKQ